MGKEVALLAEHPEATLPFRITKQHYAAVDELIDALKRDKKWLILRGMDDFFLTAETLRPMGVLVSGEREMPLSKYERLRASLKEGLDSLSQRSGGARAVGADTTYLEEGGASGSTAASGTTAQVGEHTGAQAERAHGRSARDRGALRQARLRNIGCRSTARSR